MATKRTIITPAFLVFVSLTLSQAAARANESSFDTKPWLEDFAQLKQILADDYPNLLSQAQAYKLNLSKLNEATEMKLRQATSALSATTTLKEFVASFQDGHLQLQIPKSAAGEVKLVLPDINRSTPGQTACKAMADWKPAEIQFAFPTTKPLGFNRDRVQAEAFSTVVFRANNTNFGIIRIPSFVPAQYPALCANEWEIFRKHLKSACDLKCQDRFFEFNMQNRLLAEFAAALTELKKSSVQALVLDVTDNGGGKDWVAGVMRILTRHKILCGQFGFIRNQHWTQQFDERERDLKNKLSSTKDPAVVTKLSNELSQIRSDLRESKIRCNRDQVWKSADFASKCDLVVKRLLDDCEPGGDFHFSTGLFDGPLFVLTNKRTASASEDIVGRFKDSGIATIIGERTAGAGCGFTNGGMDLKLSRSHLIVKVPDCARYSRLGVNEVEGISPDVELDMSQMKTEKFVNTLRAALTNQTQKK